MTYPNRVVNTFCTLFPKKSEDFSDFLKNLNEINHIKHEKNFNLFLDFLHFGPVFEVLGE